MSPGDDHSCIAASTQVGNANRYSYVRPQPTVFHLAVYAMCDNSVVLAADIEVDPPSDTYGSADEIKFD